MFNLFSHHHDILTSIASSPVHHTEATSFLGRIHPRLSPQDIQRTASLWESKGLVGHYGESQEVGPSRYARFLKTDEGEIDFDDVEVVNHRRKSGTTNSITFTNLLDNAHACFAKSNMCLAHKEPNVDEHPGFLFQNELEKPGIVHVKLTDSTPGRPSWTFWDQTFELGAKKALHPLAAPMTGKKNIPFQSLCASPDGPHLYELTIEEQAPPGMKLPRSLSRRPPPLPNSAAPHANIPCTRANGATRCLGADECVKNDGTQSMTPCSDKDTNCVCKPGFGKCSASSPCTSGLQCVADDMSATCTKGSSCHCKYVVATHPVPLLAERIQFLVKEPVSNCFCRPNGQGCEPDTYLPPASSAGVDNEHEELHKGDQSLTVYGPIKNKVGTVEDPDPFAKEDVENGNTNAPVIAQPTDDTGGPIKHDGTVPVGDVMTM